jgi:uncharacterized membrane protein
MHTARLEAFTDAVIAIIMTIMVLELKVPHGADWNALRPLIPVFLSYVMSYTYLGIYWNNHHHLLHATDHIDGRVLLANLHLLFWLSLIPFTTAWMAENHFSVIPTAAYGAVLFLAAVAYSLLYLAIIQHEDANHELREAIGKDRKGNGSIALYVLALIATPFNQWISIGIYVVVALMWLIPDRRIERKLGHRTTGKHNH